MTPTCLAWPRWTAVKYETVTVLVCLTFVLIGWLVWGYAEVPIVDYTYNGTLLAAAGESVVCPAALCPDVSIGRASVVLKVSVAPISPRAHPNPQPGSPPHPRPHP